MERLPLFVVIAIWVVLAIIAFLLAMSWLGRTPFWKVSLDYKTQAKDIVQIALTIVGGVSAVTYLVIQYQGRQQAKRDEERTKNRLIDAKMQQAVDQLGSDKASTRIAGVYALADVADTYRGRYRQRVVDILCGYMRSDRETYPLGADGKPVMDQSKSGDADKAVESTIISVICEHLRKTRKDGNGEIRVRQLVDDDQLWCDCAFDLHGATFHEDVDLMDTTFVRGLNFNGSKFEGHANFKRAIFKGYAVFIGTAFEGDANFNRATFGGDADFSKTTFKRLMGFRGTTVKHTVDLSGTMFKDDADFSEATFEGSADFKRTTFEGRTQLIDATFKKHSGFIGATFEGDTYFNGAKFRNKTIFSETEGRPSFDRCKFNRQLRDVIENGIKACDFGSIPIPEDNDGLPAGAVWADFPQEDDTALDGR